MRVVLLTSSVRPVPGHEKIKADCIKIKDFSDFKHVWGTSCHWHALISVLWVFVNVPHYPYSPHTSKKIFHMCFTKQISVWEKTCAEVIRCKVRAAHWPLWTFNTWAELKMLGFCSVQLNNTQLRQTQLNILIFKKEMFFNWFEMI